jgi:hypothetical protein
MGLKALYNGVVKFDKVHIPKENLILDEGRGLKVALTTLNTGRITLPAACVGMAKQCLEWATDWSRSRVQWGQAIGKHDAIAQKLARIAGETFAMEAMVLYTSALVDLDKKNDIRIEAAFAKMWGTERGWEIANETMQIRGGRGYETAPSLEARGEPGVPIERMVRDCRINTIFEGSSEIMRLMIAREALDPHLNMGGPVLNTKLPMKERLKAAVRSGGYYAFWYPMLWVPAFSAGARTDPAFRSDLRKVRNLSKKLARSLFHAMLRYGPKLDKKQVLLGRFIDIGAELFTMTASISRAGYLIETGKAENESELKELVRYYCKLSRVKVAGIFREVRSNADGEGYRVARSLLD